MYKLLFGPQISEQPQKNICIKKNNTFKRIFYENINFFYIFWTALNELNPIFQKNIFMLIN